MAKWLDWFSWLEVQLSEEEHSIDREAGFGRKTKFKLAETLGHPWRWDSDLKLRSDFWAVDKIWESLAIFYR